MDGVRQLAELISGLNGWLLKKKESVFSSVLHLVSAASPQLRSAYVRESHC